MSQTHHHFLALILMELLELENHSSSGALQQHFENSMILMKMLRMPKIQLYVWHQQGFQLMGFVDGPSTLGLTFQLKKRANLVSFLVLVLPEFKHAGSMLSS